MFDHPLWRQKPVATAFRLLTCIARQRFGSPLAVISYDEGRAKIEVDVRTRFGYTLYRYGHHDPDIELVKRLLAPGDIFVDGGAHVGLFTLAAAAKVGKSGNVIAFEPASETRRHLLRNVAVSGFDWVQVFPNALADHAETREFIAFGEEAWGSSSFAPPEGLPGQRLETVETVTLDDALANVDSSRLRLVKLDLEGAEYAALQGMTRLMTESKPDLLIEMEPEHLARQGASPEAIFRLLTTHGYTLYRPVGEQELAIWHSGETPKAEGHSPNVLATADRNRLQRTGFRLA